MKVTTLTDSNSGTSSPCTESTIRVDDEKYKEDDGVLLKIHNWNRYNPTIVPTILKEHGVSSELWKGTFERVKMKQFYLKNNKWDNEYVRNHINPAGEFLFDGFWWYSLISFPLFVFYIVWNWSKNAIILFLIIWIVLGAVTYHGLYRFKLQASGNAAKEIMEMWNEFLYTEQQEHYSNIKLLLKGPKEVPMTVWGSQMSNRMIYENRTTSAKDMIGHVFFCYKKPTLKKEQSKSKPKQDDWSTIVESLERLASLKEKGTLTDEEFTRSKSLLFQNWEQRMTNVQCVSSIATGQVQEDDVSIALDS